MNSVNGAASACASFDITASGFAGSYGAAKACVEASLPENIREVCKKGEERSKRGYLEQTYQMGGRDSFRICFISKNGEHT